jgi:DNA primase
MDETEFRALIDEIKEKADIVDIVGSVLDLKKQGKDWFALCPFHADSDPSFSVVPAKQIFHCFGCGAQGDVFEFWSKYHNVNFWDAVKAIADRVGVKISGSGPASTWMRYPEQKRQKEWEPVERELPSEVWMEKARKFIYWGYEKLFERPDVLEYLAGRGIRLRTIGAYGLGWCEKEKGGDLYRTRESWGLPTELKNNGKKKRLWFPKGVIIPTWDERYRVISIYIRRPPPIKIYPDIRYYFLPGGCKSVTVLNPNARAYVIIESYLDALLIIQEAGDLVGTVCLSTSHAKPDAAAAQVLSKSLHIINALDFDHAGAGAWPWWKKHFPECERWPVPKGKDPGEAYQAGVNIREWIKAGLPRGLRD